MFDDDQYELIDFGAGRRLERFGCYVLDRPAPAAAGVTRRSASPWSSADARYERDSAAEGTWTRRPGMRCPWRIRHGELVFSLKLAESGAIGLFPEQAENWDWIAVQVRRAPCPLKILNLFAYTGGSTLAAAAAGAQVVHVDAARSVVGWARHNAHLAGLDKAPIRWIVEDARVFAERELRRGSEYDAVILDPPTYGHGPKSRSWKVDQHLPDLLTTLGKLTRRRRIFILLTCHSPDLGPDALRTMLADTVLGRSQGGVRSRHLSLSRGDGKLLASGVVARWCHEP